jgi:hypothetical protein
MEWPLFITETDWPSFWTGMGIMGFIWVVMCTAATRHDAKKNKTED